jgi:hypothetical protein
LSSSSELSTAQVALLIARVRRDERETVLGELKAAQDALASSSASGVVIDTLMMKKSMELLAGEAASAVRERNRLIVQLEALASEWSTTLHTLGVAERAAIEAKSEAERESSRYKSLEAVKESTINALKTNLAKEISESDASIQALVDAKNSALTREAAAVRELQEAMKSFAREEEALKVSLLADGERLAKEAASRAEQEVRIKHASLIKGAVEQFMRMKSRISREHGKRSELQIKVQQLCGAIRTIARVRPTALQIEERSRRLDAAKKDASVFNQFVGIGAIVDTNLLGNSSSISSANGQQNHFSPSETAQDVLSVMEMESELESLIKEEEGGGGGGGSGSGRSVGKKALQSDISSPTPFLVTKSNGTIKVSNRTNIHHRHSSSFSSKGALEFSLDDAMGPLGSQSTLFECVQPLVSAVAFGSTDGFIFSAGQVNSGKTYSLGMSPRSFSLDSEDDEDEGIAPRAIRSLIQLLSSDSRRKSVLVVSAFEIVNDLIFDLCTGGTTNTTTTANDQSPRKTNDNSPRRGGGVDVGRESGLSLSETKSGEVVITGLSEWTFQMDGNGNDDHERVSKDEMFKLLRAAATRRRQGPTASAAAGTGKSSSSIPYRPSLSHMILRIKVQHLNESTDSRASSVFPESTTLTIADLAGAEKLGGGGGSVNDARSPRDAKNANEALASLEILFSAIRRGAKHIPFRDSKLTFCLKNELGGSAQVVCLACVSNEEADAKLIVNTLAFSEACRSTLLKRGSLLASPRESPRS